MDLEVRLDAFRKSGSDADRHESAVQRLGSALREQMGSERPGVFDKDYWVGHLLDWAMRDPGFKVDLFRLIDVLPALRTNEQVSSHIREYLMQDGRELPRIMKAAIKAAAGGIGSGLAVRAFKRNVADMAGQFIAGHDASSATPALTRLRDDGFAFTVDLLGEATVSDAEADAYLRRYLELIRGLAASAEGWEPSSTTTIDEHGPLANVSVKVSALCPHLDPADPEGSVERLKYRVWPIMRAARDAGVFINFDLEQWSLHETTFSLFEDLACAPELADWPHLGIVVQAYHRSAEADLRRLVDLAGRRGAPITVRLVKGAYWDYEIVRAAQHGYPVPVLTEKAATDEQYEALSGVLLARRDRLRPAFGTHNLRSMANVLARAEESRIPSSAYEFQSLYGMAEPERRALRERGHLVRVYVPLGELLPGMAYLVRRLLENTANSGFLRLTHHDGADTEALLAPPTTPAPTREPATAAVSAVSGPVFRNASLSDFTDPTVRASFHAAIRSADACLPVDVPVSVAGESRMSEEVIEHVCPSDATRIVTRVSRGTSDDVERAVAHARDAFPAWRDRSVAERAAALERLADVLARDRVSLAALQCFEEAKPWPEADADVAEAIDFCRYYARQARTELAPRTQGDAPGEENRLVYDGLGPTVVIAPWNFPLAILCGMTTAALVAGNTVIMKPAEQSSAVAYRLHGCMDEAGLPDGVVQLLPGVGEDVGRLLVEHPDVVQIAFTGSRPVGLEILRSAAEVRPGQVEVKRVVCEMGGKNAIIVDADADLDEAVKGVAQSAFGYAGQKCSACSRVVVVGDVFDSFSRRLVEAARSMETGPAHAPSCQLPAVIDGDSHARLRGRIEAPDARVVFVGEAPASGFYVPPAIFEVDDAGHPLMQEELFGPIVALHRVADFEAALGVANGTAFALTGGVFSRTPSHIERARAMFRVGNLYVNRAITGALVQRQPFGGFRMSGAGTKAGGPGYLSRFAQPRVVTESTMRSGFTPDVGI